MGLIVSLEVGAGGQAGCSDAVDHGPVAQNRHVEAVAVEGHQRRSKTVYAGGKRSDEIDLTPFADVGGAQRLDAPNAVDPLCDQRSENSDLVERKLRKLLAEDFDSLIVGEGIATVEAGEGLRARDGFEIEDNGVLAQKTSGLWPVIVSYRRDLSSRIPPARSPSLFWQNPH